MMKFNMDANANGWNDVPKKNKKPMRFKKTREALWGTLDDIDTLLDMYHPSSEEAYRKVSRLARTSAADRLRKSPKYRDPYCKRLRSLLKQIVVATKKHEPENMEEWRVLERIYTQRFNILGSDGYNLVPHPTNYKNKK